MGDTSAMQVADARVVQPSYLRTGFGEMIDIGRAKPPQPKQEKVVGLMADTVLFLDGPRTAASAIAGIVAIKYPRASVTLMDFRCTVGIGIWMNNIEARISARIEQDGHALTINALGRNHWSNPSAENYERGYERALADFARQVADAPSDLSRAE